MIRLRSALAAAAVVVVALTAPTPAAARGATPIATFDPPTTSFTYGREIVFTQPVTVQTPIARVELLIDSPDSVGPQVNLQDTQPGVGSTALTFRLDLTAEHLLPNTVLTGRWRLTGTNGDIVVGPPATVRYEDTGFDWKIRQGSIVRVHWYQGSDAFGQRALEIGEQAMADTSKLLGVTETQPVDFYVYADQTAFYAALGPGTRENVGGTAIASIRTLFALIPPTSIDDPWVGIVIPHELVHLVIDTAIHNPYHYLPRWLNEGTAVYLSEGYGASDRGLVEGAAADGSLIPLDGLVAEFPTSRDRFFLAYAESVSAVDYLLRHYGQDALVGMLRSYADGVTDAEAFSKALGVDTKGFDAAWRAELKAKPASVFGPQPAPPGPVPRDWTTGPGSSPAGTPPSAANGLPGGGSPLPASPAPVSGSSGDSSLPWLAGIAIVVLVSGAFAVRRLRQRSAASRDGRGSGRR